MTISFEEPAVPSVIAYLVCEWEPGPRIFDLTGHSDDRGAAIQGTLAGEAVGFVLNPDLPWRGDPLFAIYHSGAEYRPGPTTGTVEMVTISADLSSGTIAFDHLAPDAESADPGPLPSPLADWIRPLGGDAAMASLTGTVSWSCEPAPASVPTASLEPASPRPVPTPGPTTSYPASPPFFDGVPPLVLESGDQRQWGATWCGYYPETCAPGGNGALGVASIVTVPAGGTLTFELPHSCHFIHWSLSWVAQAEHERWRGEWPTDAQQAGTGGKTKGRILELPAPAAGDWSVLLGWKSTCDGPETGTIDDLFRVLVQG